MADAVARPVGFGQALAEQLRWFWRRLWVWILVVALVVAGMVSWLISLLSESEASMGIIIIGTALHPLLLLVALSWAFSAWRDDPPRDRQYFWLHPVPRTAHTIARTVAGGLWLFLVLTFIVLVVLASTYLMHGAAGTLGTPRFWLYVAASICMLYLFASIAPILSDRPGGWLFGLIAVVLLADVVAVIRQLEWLERAVAVFKGGSHSLTTALTAPSIEAMRLLNPEQWGSAADDSPLAAVAEAEPGAALLIWLPVALVLYLLAARLSRPR